MKEPWAPIFDCSRTVFSDFQVLIPGLGKVEMDTRPKLILSPVDQKSVIQDVVVVVKRTHLVALNADWISASGDAFQF